MITVCGFFSFVRDGLIVDPDVFDHDRRRLRISRDDRGINHSHPVLRRKPELAVACFNARGP